MKIKYVTLFQEILGQTNFFFFFIIQNYPSKLTSSIMTSLIQKLLHNPNFNVVERVYLNFRKKLGVKFK